MRRRFYLTTVLCFFSALFTCSSSVHGQQRDIYWVGATDHGQSRANAIFRYSLTTARIDTLVRAKDLGPSPGWYFIAVAFDSLQQEVYWTSTGGLTYQGYYVLGSIGRVSSLGGAPEMFKGALVCGMGSVSDIEVDPYAQLVYWGHGSDCGESYGIGVVDYGRSYPEELQELPTTGTYSVGSIEIHRTDGMIYWTNLDFLEVEPHGILRAPLNRTTAEEYIVQETICDIALAQRMSKVYWTPCESDVIRRSNLDGSDIENVIATGTALSKMAIDQVGNTIYWTDTQGGTLNRANLDGTAIETILSGLALPGSLALSFGGLEHTANESGAALPQPEIKVDVFPNPSRGNLSITLKNTLPQPVRLEIIDNRGRLVHVVGDRAFGPGFHTITWQADLPPGVYFCRALGGGQHALVSFSIGL